MDSLARFNLMGKIEITDNIKYGQSNNLCLQDGVDSNAFINNGGLESGSKIGINTTKDDPGSKGVVVSNSITEFAMKEYFTADKDSTDIKLEGTEVKTEFYQASMIIYDLTFLIISASLAVVLLVLTVIAYKRKREGVAGDGKMD